jgi:rhamnose transport system ATP-binding protein
MEKASMAEILRAENLTKSFAGVQALRRGAIDLRAGEIHALVGENGAGKSTLIRIIAGALSPDSGSLTIGGHPVTEFSPVAARDLGVSVIYQQPALFPDLTVIENLALGLESPNLWRRIDWTARRKRAVELLDRAGAVIDPDSIVSSLSMPQQQLVEIARALGRAARILILDEPTASLSEREVGNLFRILRELRRQGLAIVYISHRIEEIFALADRVTVLRDGETVLTESIEQIDRASLSRRASLIRMMVGREIEAVFPKREVAIGETILRVDNLSSSAAGLSNISLELRTGEILGLAGLVGAGRSELARCLFGLHSIDTGSIWIRGEQKESLIHSPADAIEAGIAYVPEDRRRHGVIQELSIVLNGSLAILPRLTRRGLLDQTRERELAAFYAERLRLRADTLYASVSTLSGGNQQKVALARWLATNPSILILDEPTQGIDVGAKAEIHLLMGELAATGMAILMISSELPEILGMCDRIAVMRGGRISATLERSEATPERIISIALGAPGSHDLSAEDSAGNFQVGA